jgi:hypothetical protein
MRRFFLTAAFLAGFSAQVSAGVVVHIDNSAQRMQVYVDGGLAYVWPVSTARRGYWTPPGNYYVQRMARMWYSRKYDMSPLILCSSTAATPSTAPARSASLDGQRAMAACACTRPTRALSTGWWDLTAAPASWSGHTLNTSEPSADPVPRRWPDTRTPARWRGAREGKRPGFNEANGRC